jgi:sugar O-acyltransferase (sialic acid O-acetyltransferase NeuD family)
MKDVVIFGAGEFAEIAHFYFTNDSPRRVAAFTVNATYLDRPSFKDLPVVPFEELEKLFPPEKYDMFVAVAYVGVNRVRATKVLEAEAKGYRLANYVSSRARLWPGLRVGQNTFIMEFTETQPFVEIGRNVIIWAASKIGFHVRIGDHCWITTAVIGGTATVGDYSFIGINATISSYVSVGDSCVIGAGAVILKDTKDFEVYRANASTPSRVPSTRLKRF